MNAIGRLKGVVKEYDWGGTAFIPALLQQENPDLRPFAEYWMGVHPQGLASVEASQGRWVPLADWTPSLPFLLKVLDVKNMLSIQVHPNKADAQREFDHENQLGLSLNDPLRSYKDNNHKPELMVALSEFWLLHGFKPAQEMAATLSTIGELNSLLSVFEKEGYRGLYRYVMEMPQASVDQLLAPLRNRVLPLFHQGLLEKNNPDYWAAKAFLSFDREGQSDRGIFSIYFFNLIKAIPGQAIFQDAGIPHAYLEGQNVEIMANSDNVLRGGLTSKHVAVKELMKHVLFDPVSPILISPDPQQKEYWFNVPISDFSLSAIQLEGGEEAIIHTALPTLLLCTTGATSVESEGLRIALQRGEPVAFCQAGKEIRITALETTRLFRAQAGLPAAEK